MRRAALPGSSGAAALFELMADGAAAIGEAAEGAEAVGDASSLTLHEGAETAFGAPAVWLALHVHAGRDVAGVLVVDNAGGTPDPEAAVALGERLLERIAAVRDGDSPGLAPLTLQLAPDDEIAFPGPYYLQLDGAALPVGTAYSGIGKYLETTADDGARAAFYDEVGAVDVYFHHQQLRGGPEAGTQDYYYEAVLLRFGDEAAAEAYLAGLPDRYADDGDAEDLERLDEVPAAGDEAVAFAYRADYGNTTLFHHATSVSYTHLTLPTN